jgi:hypothetical protein
LKINLLRAAAVPLLLGIAIIAGQLAISGVEYTKESLLKSLDEFQHQKIQPAVNSAIAKITPHSSSIEEQSQEDLSTYETRWVKGRPLRECMGPGNAMDESTIRCQKGYYEKDPIDR